MVRKKHGGKRKKAGRKPIDEAEKKQQLNIYVEQKKIDSVGGADSAKSIAISAINYEYEKGKDRK